MLPSKTPLVQLTGEVWEAGAWSDTQPDRESLELSYLHNERLRDTWHGNESHILGVIFLTQEASFSEMPIADKRHTMDLRSMVKRPATVRQALTHIYLEALGGRVLSLSHIDVYWLGP